MSICMRLLYNVVCAILFNPSFIRSFYAFVSFQSVYAINDKTEAKKRNLNKNKNKKTNSYKPITVEEWEVF